MPCHRLQSSDDQTKVNKIGVRQPAARPAKPKALTIHNDRIESRPLGRFFGPRRGELSTSVRVFKK
jgi:hypothetical protein